MPHKYQAILSDVNKESISSELSGHQEAVALSSGPHKHLQRRSEAQYNLLRHVLSSQKNLTPG